MTPRAVLIAVALLAMCRPELAQSQDGISATPLPPPGAPPPAQHGTSKPPAHPQSVLGRVPVVRPPHAPARKPPAKSAGTHGQTATPAKPAPPPKAAPKAATPGGAVPAPPEAAPPAPKPDPRKGSNSGLPLPRWASFRTDEVNLRSGPGMQYPIDWVYHRRDLPVQILREFEVWRLIRLQDDTKGWVHSATLTRRRGFVVQGGEQLLRGSADDAAEAVARLKPDVVGLVRHCAADSPWCEVQVGGYRGWLKRDAIFGVSLNEAVE